jgi:two-component system, cell cycle sensor histidine kinase and response regulator CckA
VDDDDQVVKSLSKILSLDGHEVITATSGEAALKCLQQTLPCMALLDVMMPGMNGLELCRRIKQDPRTADVPVALVTGQVGTVDVDHGLEAGAIDYLKKPVDPDELRVRVRAQIRLHETLKMQRRIEKHLSLISSTAKDAVIIIDNDGAVTHWNAAATAMFGYAEDEIVGRNLHELLAPKRYQETHLLAFSRFREEGHGGAINRTVELEALRRSGEEFPIELSLSATNIEGKWCAIGIVRDISERKRIESSIRDSEALYRSLFENMLNGFAHCRMLFDHGRPVDFIYLNVNQAFEVQTGLRNVVGRKVSEVIPGIRESDPKLLEVYGRVATSGKSEALETYVQALDMWFAISVYCPKVEHFVAVFDVITGRKRAEDELRASRDLMTGILDNMQDAFIRADNDGRIIMVSPSAVSLYGYDSMQEMIGLPTAMLYESEEARRDFMEELRQQEIVTDRIGRARRKDGGLFWVSLNARFFRDRQDQVVGAECFVRDITERMSSEEAVRKSEEWHRTILHTAMDGFWLVNTEGRILEVNEAYCRMSGYRAEELLGMHISDVATTKAADPTGARITRIIAHGDDRFESLHRRKDGSMFDVEVSAQYHRADGGRLVVFLRDISERKKSEEILREKEFTLSESQRLGHVGSWFWDMQGPISWSDEMYRLYGVSPDTFAPTAESFVRLIYPDDRLAMQEWIAACASEQNPGELEFRIIMPDGAVHYFRGRGQAVHGGGNGPTHMAGTVQDITSNKEATLAKEKLEEQLRVAQKMEAIGRLAGGVAHDFNNLLSVILLYTGFALAGTKEGRAIEGDLLQVKKGAQRAVVLTRQLLAFSRKQVMQTVPVNLNTVATELQNMLRRIIGEHIDFVQVLAPDLGLTLADSGQIEQVFMNLVVNARDAMSGGGKLTIETSNVEIYDEFALRQLAVDPGPYVQLTIKDSGHGMDEQTQARIFEPFFTTKPKGKGTGLGLSTVYGIVRQSGGAISVTSKPNQGTLFKICLPRLISPTYTIATIPPTASTRTTGNETILLVEDEEALLTAASRTLESAGYKVLTALDGNDALLTSAQHPGDIHLLLTDVIMPRMSGMALALELSTTRPNVKALYMSGYFDDTIEHHGVLDAATNLLSKPFSAAELMQKVREVLDGVFGTPVGLRGV